MGLYRWINIHLPADISAASQAQIHFTLTTLWQLWGQKQEVPGVPEADAAAGQSAPDRSVWTPQATSPKLCCCSGCRHKRSDQQQDWRADCNVFLFGVRLFVLAVSCGHIWWAEDLCHPAGHQLVQRPLQASTVVQREATLSVRWLETWRLRNGSGSICSLTVYLVLTAGLDKLITVNCVPPPHNQLM